MTLKVRIRTELDKSANGDNFGGVLETIIREGVSEDELREILPDIIKQVARTRVAAPFMAPRPVVRIPAPLPAPGAVRAPVAAPYAPSIPVNPKDVVSVPSKNFPSPVGSDTLVKAVEAPVRPAPVVVRATPTVNSTPELLPKAKQVFVPSAKVQAFQSNRLEELYPVGSGQHKKLKNMNREDIRFNVRMLEGRVKGLEGRIKGWNKVLDQMISYKVNVVEELPDTVKEKI